VQAGAVQCSAVQCSAVQVQAAAMPSSGSATGRSAAVAAARTSQVAASPTNIVQHDYAKGNSVLSNNDEGIQDGTSPLPVNRNGDASNLRVGAPKTERYPCPVCSSHFSTLKKLLLHAAVQHHRRKLMHDFHISLSGGSTCSQCHYKCSDMRLLSAHIGLAHRGLLPYFSDYKGCSQERLLEVMSEYGRAEARIYACKKCPGRYSSHVEAMEHVTRAHLDRETRNDVETALRPQPHKEGSYICILCGREVGNRLRSLLNMEQEHKVGISNVLELEELPIMKEGEVPPQQQQTPPNSSSSRRYICSKCPNNEWSNEKRSDLYLHYAWNHYQKEICDQYGKLKECPLCPDGYSLPNKRSIVYHFGVAHNMVDLFLEPEHRIKAQKRGLSKTKDISESRKGALSHDSAEPPPASGSSSSLTGKLSEGLSPPYGCPSSASGRPVPVFKASAATPRLAGLPPLIDDI